MPSGLAGTCGLFTSPLVTLASMRHTGKTAKVAPGQHISAHLRRRRPQRPSLRWLFDAVRDGGVQLICRLYGYEGYPVIPLPANVSDADQKAKRSVFYTYARHDKLVCGVLLEGA